MQSVKLYGQGPFVVAHFFFFGGGGISGESNYDAPRANGMCHGKIL